MNLGDLRAQEGRRGKIESVRSPHNSCRRVRRMPGCKVSTAGYLRNLQAIRRYKSGCAAKQPQGASGAANDRRQGNRLAVLTQSANSGAAAHPNIPSVIEKQCSK